MEGLYRLLRKVSTDLRFSLSFEFESRDALVVIEKGLDGLFELLMKPLLVGMQIDESHH